MKLAPPIARAPADRVVIVGAGPAGMATALELAQRGVPTVVLERRGGPATREPLFNVAPAFADRLAALDPEGSLTRLLTPVTGIESRSSNTDGVVARQLEGALAPDASRSRGDMDALMAALDHRTSTGADKRRWATVGIGDLENGMRQLARTTYSDLIDLRTDTEVAGVRQGDGWAEAVLARGGVSGANDAVRGAILVDASGRGVSGGDRTTFPERTFWIGARYPARPDGDQTIRRIRGEDAQGRRQLTVSLPSHDRTLVWTQVHEEPGSVAADDARALIGERASSVGVTEPLPSDARVMPTTAQLWTSDQPADGRVLKVGDALRGPYFMTSSGAATAFVHDAPRAVDAITAIFAGAPVRETSTAYADAVHGANAQLLRYARPALLTDAGVPISHAGPPATAEGGG